MPVKLDMVGKVFGRATVLNEGPRMANGRRTVNCRCICGSPFNTEPRLLSAGLTQSCGCLQRERVAEVSARRTKHGMAQTPEHNTWGKIKSRCINEHDAKYADYGGRGIKVCDAWLNSFEQFFRDMGEKPHLNSSIDRIDVNGDYTPENCRWASPKEQSRNKRNNRYVEFQGRSMSLSEACELSGVNYRSALYRLNVGKGWQPLPAPPVQEMEG